MKQIKPNDPETRSADLVQENLDRLKALFPDAFVEGKVDFEALKQLLGGAVETGDEKYGLNWHGKRMARQLALTPSNGTLRPCPEESIDWDTTRNLFLEGDNLEVLKLLQKPYASSVSLIYIDPPYNTGGDFVYHDSFHASIANYIRQTQQADAEGKRLTSNTEASGRFHTNWLNMMYPRLRVAKTLLRPDGFLLVSISDVELPRLRLLCDEIFGEESFVALLIWQKGREGGNDNAGFGQHHEYVACYAANPSLATRRIALDAKDTSRHMTALPEANLVVDGETVYRDGDEFQLINLSKQKDYRVRIPLKDGSVLEWDSYCPQSTIDGYIRVGKVFVGERRVPYIKSFLADEQAGTKPSTLIEQKYGTTKAGGIAIRDLFGSKDVFSYPKPPQLMARLVSLLATPTQTSSEAPIVMDFFAGSGTTAHGLWEQCASDSVQRRFILVQLPEPLNPEERDHAAAVAACRELGRPTNIAELTKERLRRASKAIKAANPLFAGDLGFKVFKLDTSNLRAWNPRPENIGQALLESLDHLEPGRTESDVLHELLLKLNVDLSTPIISRIIGGKQAHSIGAGTILACLATSISVHEVETIAMGLSTWHSELSPATPTTVVFRDSAFDNDVAKSNLVAILQQHGLTNVRSL